MIVYARLAFVVEVPQGACAWLAVEPAGSPTIEVAKGCAGGWGAGHVLSGANAGGERLQMELVATPVDLKIIWQIGRNSRPGLTMQFESLGDSNLHALLSLKEYPAAGEEAGYPRPARDCKPE